MITVLKKFAKDSLPNFLLVPLKNSYHYFSKKQRTERKLIHQAPKRHAKAIERIQKKNGPINVVFFAIFDSTWKYDELYQRMDADPRFYPTILVCPFVSYGQENMLKTMDNCYKLFNSRGYNVIKSYNSSTNEYVDVKADLKPDIIFYTNPYKGLSDDRYYISHFSETLTCYTSYFFSNSNKKELIDTFLHNAVWKRYVENSWIIKDSIISNRNHGINCINSGYPGFDNLISNKNPINDPWKIKNREIKRIIWAPHHTISKDGLVFSSTFLIYCNIMLDIAKKYDSNIQIAFKPHPLLKNRLEALWGKTKTIEYYKKWETLPNGLLNDGAYEDLFLTSDAIIHDCGSFIGEYLVTNNPGMFLLLGDKFNDQYNQLGYKCLENYYIGKNRSDIENFILDIITGNDYLKEKRRLFVKNELIPPNGKTASENIIDDLVTSLNLNKK